MDDGAPSWHTLPEPWLYHSQKNQFGLADQSRQPDSRLWWICIDKEVGLSLDQTVGSNLQPFIQIVQQPLRDLALELMLTFKSLLFCGCWKM